MKVNLDVGIMGERGKPIGRPIRRVIRSLAHFVAILESKNLAPELKQAVLKIAAGYPEGALDHVYTNLHHIISTCAANLAASKPKMNPIIPEAPAVNKPVSVPEGEPQIFMPSDPLPQPVVEPRPQIQRKSLFENLESTTVGDVPTVSHEKPPKWSTAPVKKIKEQQRQKLESNSMMPSPQQPRQQFPPPIKRADDMDELHKKFLEMIQREPPREGNQKSN